jgi:hypothetical protein
MPAERTIRIPKRPLTYAFIVAAAALVLAAAVAATWRLAHDAPVAPMQIGERAGSPTPRTP